LKDQVRKTLIVQYIFGAFFILGAGLLERSVMLSAIVGCLAGLVPNTYFCFKMSRQSKNDDAIQWLGYAYRAEFGKWLMTGMIFVLAFTSGHSWQPVVLFAGYCLILISSWFVPFMIKGN
jgi:ATP synthase protein I